MSSLNQKSWITLFLVFIAFSVIFLFLRMEAQSAGINYNVLLAGNAVLFLATVGSLLFSKKGLSGKNAYAFVRMIYAGMMFKLFLCLLAALIYIFVAKSSVSKSAIFICFGLYCIYTWLEVKYLMGLSKQQNG